MYDYYDDYEEMDNTKSSHNKNIWNILIIILGLSIAVIAIIIITKLNNNEKVVSNTYSDYEKKLVRSADDYVSSNNIVVDREVYFDIELLNVEIPNNCAKTSGVLYNGREFKPYLSCSDYESKIIDNDDDVISLLGSSVIVITSDMQYNDPGYNSVDDVDVSGEINRREGVYNIFYYTSYATLNRKVIVLDNPSLSFNYPKMQMNGDSTIIINLNDQYHDEGISAQDTIDGDITSNIKKQDNINPKIPGKYHVVYEVVNSRGYKSIASREVIVVDKLDNLNIISDLYPNITTSGDVEIIINVIGNDYNYTLLPNNEKSTRSMIQYKVSENGTYEFKFYNKSGNEIIKTIEVNNIDRTTPEGSCVATIQNDGTKVEVKSSLSKSYSYNYIINNQESGFKISQNFQSSTINASSVQVKIRDSLGNDNTITCEIVDKKLNYNPNGYNIIIKDKPRIHEPIAQALSKKGYSVYDLNTCIYNKVVKAGPGTRYGVVEAAYGLIECTLQMTGAVLPYNHTSGKVETDSDGRNYCEYNSDICGKLGVNTRWGSPGGTCSNDPNKQCWHGMNCATFVGWAMCNGGMDMCTRRSAGAFSMASTNYFPEADGVRLVGRNVTRYSGNDLTGYGADALVRMVKPGDVIARQRVDDNDGSSHHVFVVIGKDETGIYTANDGYYIEKISYSYMTSGEMIFRILFLDNYYANAKNKNHLYPE